MPRCSSSLGALQLAEHARSERSGDAGEETVLCAEEGQGGRQAADAVANKDDTVSAGAAKRVERALEKAQANRKTVRDGKGCQKLKSSN